MSEDVRTYRGRTLAEILPKIREELGDDAVVLRRREGLTGGVGGFFAKAFVEVQARAGGPRLDVRDDDPAEPEDVAPAPARPAVAAPASALDFADALAAFAPEPALPAEPPAPAVRALPAAEAAPAPAAQAPASGFARLLADAYAGGFGQPAAEPPAPAVPAPPAVDAIAVPVPPAAEPLAPPAEPVASAVATAERPLADVSPVVPDYVPAELERAALPALAAAENHATAEAAPTGREEVHAQAVHGGRAAAAAEEALVAGGCTPAFAAAVVGEAVAHGLPFASPRSLRRLVREALVRRVPVAPPRGAHAVVALVGPAGAGRTTAAGRLAAAYAAGSDLTTRAVALRAGDGGAELAALVPAGTASTAATAAEAAEVVAAAGERAMVVLDVPAVSARDEAGVKALRRELRAAGVTEVHVVLPATTGAAAARALLAAVRPLKPAGLLVTHAEDAAGAGAALELAAAEGLPLVWQGDAAALRPADAAALAAEVLR